MVFATVSFESAGVCHGSVIATRDDVKRVDVESLLQEEYSASIGTPVGPGRQSWAKGRVRCS